MGTLDKIEDYKEIYYKELERAECLKNKISTSLTLLTVIGSALIYIFNNVIKYSVGFEFLPSLVAFCTCICFILFIIEGVLFIKAHTSTYKYFPIKGFHEFEEQCENDSWENANEKAKYIEDTKKDLYFRASVHNRVANNRKVDTLNLLYKFIIINLGVLLLTYVFLCFANKQ